MQVLGVFLGVDALAKTFGSGIGWLAGVLAGYLIHAAGDHFHFRVHVEEWFRRIGKYTALVFFTIFLFRVGLLQALIFLGKRLIIPANLVIALFAMLFGTAIWMMWREPTAIYLHRSNAQTEALEGYLFPLPKPAWFLDLFRFPAGIFLFYQPNRLGCLRKFQFYRSGKLLQNL